MDLELPAGFTDLLQEFTVHVLQEKPDDIVDFAANYFMKLKLKEKRSKEGTKRKSKGVSFHSEEVNGDGNSDDEDDDDDDEEIGMNCSAAKLSHPYDMVAIGEVSILRKDFKNPSGVYFNSFSPFATPRTLYLISYRLLLKL